MTNEKVLYVIAGFIIVYNYDKSLGNRVELSGYMPEYHSKFEFAVRNLIEYLNKKRYEFLEAKQLLDIIAPFVVKAIK